MTNTSKELRMVSDTQELAVAQGHPATTQKQINTELLSLKSGWAGGAHSLSLVHPCHQPVLVPPPQP